MSLLLLLFTPLLAALCSFFFSSRLRVLEWVLICASLLECLIAGVIVHSVVTRGGVEFLPYFSVHALETILIMIISVVGLASAWYSLGYVRAESAEGNMARGRIWRYVLLFHLFLFSLFLSILTTSPIVMWIAIEATTLDVALLIIFYNTRGSVEAAWKYLILNSVALLIGFLGTILFLSGIPGQGELFIHWNLLAGAVPAINPIIAKIAFVLILIGYGTKVGLVPLHLWRPDTYSTAPLPIVALLSGGLVNVAFLAILRFKMVTDAAGQSAFTGGLLIGFGLLSITLASAVIFSQGNYKRLLAWSTIEHAGVIALGFGFGGKIGVFGALLHMLYHSLTKAFLFCTAGNIHLASKRFSEPALRGMLKVIPASGVLFLLGCLAISGVPPFGIFKSELLIASAGISRFPLVAGVAVLAVAWTFVGFFKQASTLLFGEPSPESLQGRSEKKMLAAPIFLAILFIILGFWLPQPLKILLADATTFLTH